jgi:6-pyruvoyltetrahydropterin/6-carboxytetrahydropterin synthase
MKVKLSRQFRFEASHQLSHLTANHPCHSLHGHGYQVEIEVEGEVNPEIGFLIDYNVLKEVADPFINQLDHQHLNDVEGLGIASTEYIAAWLWKRIKPVLPILSRISIQETPYTRCDYVGV